MKTLIDQQDLAKWLRQFEFSNFKNLTNICQCAYKVRKDSEMDLLLTLSGELGNGEATIPTTIAPSFRKVRHIVGRLAAYIRTVEAVLDDMHHMGDLLDVFKVAVVPRPTCVPRLQADAHTNLSGILTRMLRAQDPDFTATFEYLSALDAQTGLESQLKDLFDPEKTSPSVHAEIQMLHHFYDNDRKFFAYDNYIATSKPACFCCKLYFRHHPADYVEPDSHEKVYTNWGPICLTSGSRGRRDDPHWIAQRKILNTVIADLDREVVNEIKRRRSLAEHPDTLTELTASSQTLWGDSSDTLYDETDVSVGFGSETHSDSDGGAGI
ncbi:hypothetical protein N0V93_005657 [Gnomoniopsis smithogilvyi]|uniref:Uncharacterized protein n=1 Tax=Gnomoniopsis smithogilvyi TaxID=1191159 RepID=A0A9W8YT88_9PEZI|nr:hypothetical protein N0V93_005657 [Gnomoniopsis smithogilvyi]